MRYRHAPGAIRAFADLSQFSTQAEELTPVNEETSGMIIAVAGRYALLIPSVLLRLQVRRVLHGDRHQIFDTLGAALDWPAWPEGAIEAMPLFHDSGHRRN